MADLADVSTALVNLASAALYPSGVSSPTATSPVTGTICDIRRGWPLPQVVDAAMAAQQVLVTVHPEAGMARETSRYPLEWTGPLPAAPTLTVSVSGSAVTWAGVPAPGQLTGVLVDGAPYAYAVLAGDTLTSIAANVAGLVSGAASVGATATFPTTRVITARVVATGPQSLEVRRQDQGFCVSAWCATPTARDQVAAAIDGAVAGLTRNGNLSMFLLLPAGNFGWIRYRGTREIDTAEKATIYRRDLAYMIEYPTEQIQTFAEVLFGTLTVSTQDALARATGTILTVST